MTPAPLTARDAFEARIVVIASAIMDEFCGGDASWRKHIGDADVLGSTILDSADWQTALRYARAAARAAELPAQDDAMALLRDAAVLLDRVWPAGSATMMDTQGRERWSRDNEEQLFAPARAGFDRYRKLPSPPTGAP